ncbi:MAG: T9SS type A sorting domain-containing protein, partial [Hymenobacteraceae bacterium]|nr:T9SS type A sorting domain-containing protein [Hymenobacteraceae bacterium]
FSVTATNAGGCTGTSQTTTVTVNPQASATFAYGAADYCLSSGAPVTPTLTGTPGGVFSVLPSGLVIDDATGAVNLATSVPGTYTVTYAVAGPCPASLTQTLTLTAAPQGTFAYAATIGCAGSAGTLAPTLSAGSTAGTFSAQPAGLTIDAVTGVVTPATSLPGTYTISNLVTGTGACAPTTATATLTLLALPNVAISNLNATYCALDGPVTLSGTVNGQTAPGTFTINGQPATVFDPTALGVGAHTVAFTGTAGGGCDATVSFVVTVVAPPTQPVISVQPLAGGQVLLTSSQPTGNQWYLNGQLIVGATGPTYIVGTSSQNGNYTVICTVAGCPSVPSAPQNVQITGLTEAVAVGVALYPVPTLDGYVTLEVRATGRTADVVLFDAVGRAVWRTSFATGAATTAPTRHTLDLRTLPVGTYTLRLTTEHGTAIRRLVRE